MDMSSTTWEAGRLYLSSQPLVMPLNSSIIVLHLGLSQWRKAGRRTKLKYYRDTYNSNIVFPIIDGVVLIIGLNLAGLVVELIDGLGRGTSRAFLFSEGNSSSKFRTN